MAPGPRPGRRAGGLRWLAFPAGTAPGAARRRTRRAPGDAGAALAGTAAVSHPFSRDSPRDVADAVASPAGTGQARRQCHALVQGRHLGAVAGLAGG